MNRLFKLRQSIKYLPNSTADLLKALFPSPPFLLQGFPSSLRLAHIHRIYLLILIAYHIQERGGNVHMMMLVFRGGKLAAVQDREGGKAGGETGGDLGAKTDPFPRADNQLRRFLEEKCRARTYADSWSERKTQFRSVGMVGDKRTPPRASKSQN